MSRTGNASLQLKNVNLAYGKGARVIRDLNLDLEPGEMLALLGASGCGKTTILKLIAGLLHPDSGTIQIDGQTVNGVVPELRRAAMVFQKPLLFPYLSVAENIGFSLKLRGATDSTIRDRVREALALVRLEGFESRRPSELSGGQEQRVSLARALVSEPRILLLDEPFAALDESLRGEIRSLVRMIQRETKLTTLFVTHDQNEAAAVSHRIAFLHDGRLSQTGTLREFYERPADLETAKFFGWQTLRGRMANGYVTTALGEVEADGLAGAGWIAIRAEALRLVDSGGIAGNVSSSIDLGTLVSTAVTLMSGEIVEVHHGPPELAAGKAVMVAMERQSMRWFPER